MAEGDPNKFKLTREGIELAGAGTIVFVLLFFGFLGLGAMTYYHHTSLTTAHDEQTFFLSLPEKEKEKYELTMPPTLAGRLSSKTKK